MLISPADGSIRHHASVAACTGAETTINKKPDQAAAHFFAGLDSTWPAPENMPVHRLEPGHPLLADAHAGFQRYTCAVCGHTLRPYDVVIMCPCPPDQAMCRIAIHRDPIHGLNCWDEWSVGKNDLHCPATSRKLNE